VSSGSLEQHGRPAAGHLPSSHLGLQLDDIALVSNTGVSCALGFAIARVLRRTRGLVRPPAAFARMPAASMTTTWRLPGTGGPVCFTTSGMALSRPSACATVRGRSIRCARRSVDSPCSHAGAQQALPGPSRPPRTRADVTRTSALHSGINRPAKLVPPPHTRDGARFKDETSRKNYSSRSPAKSNVANFVTCPPP
jgi:hypothetical protein